MSWRPDGYEQTAVAARAIGAAAGAPIVATLDNGGDLVALNALHLQIDIGGRVLVAVAPAPWSAGA